MRGDEGTIRSVVSKSIKTTPETPSSFARPYLRPRKQVGETSSRDAGEHSCPPRPGDLAGTRGQAGQRLLPPKDRPQRRGERTWSKAATGVSSSVRPASPSLGLNRRFLFNSQYIVVSKNYKIFSWKPLDNKFPIWYNKTHSPLEPGESYLLLIENRIPNNRYVPGAPAGRATWLTSRLKDVRAKDQTGGLLSADAR